MECSKLFLSGLHKGFYKATSVSSASNDLFSTAKIAMHKVKIKIEIMYISRGFKS